MNYLILHGSFGSPGENWFPWLKLKLGEKGHNVYSPQLPVDDFNNFKELDEPRQTLQAWLKSIKPLAEELAASGEDLTIIAHSIAPAFVLSLMDDSPNLKVKKLIAVSPFIHHGKASKMWQFKKVNDSFSRAAETIARDQVKLNDINNRINSAVVLFGDNDPYVENEQSLKYAKLLNAEVIEIKNGGHLNAEAGYIKFKELLSLI